MSSSGDTELSKTGALPLSGVMPPLTRKQNFYNEYNKGLSFVHEPFSKSQQPRTTPGDRTPTRGTGTSLIVSPK